MIKYDLCHHWYFSRIKHMNTGPDQHPSAFVLDAPKPKRAKTLGFGSVGTFLIDFSIFLQASSKHE